MTRKPVPRGRDFGPGKALRRFAHYFPLHAHTGAVRTVSNEPGFANCERSTGTGYPLPPRSSACPAPHAAALRCTPGETYPVPAAASIGLRLDADPASGCDACVHGGHSVPEVPPQCAPAQCPAASTTTTAATVRPRPQTQRRTVLRPDGLRKSILAEDRLKDRPHPLAIGLLYHLGAQKITAPRIADCQRIDPRSVAAAKPALEIGAPHSVRIHGMLQRFCVWLGPVPFTPSPLLIFAIQQGKLAENFAEL